MQYTDFGGDRISRLGFGLMRLPLVEGGTPSDIDEEETKKLLDYAYENGVNYFDSAKPYHGEMSEVVAGKLLKRYPREKIYFATKYPGHVVTDSYDPERTFDIQLRKCGVDYFDYYLLHNISDGNIDVYEDEKWGILEYFKKQKDAGKIRHLGFSSHATLPMFERILDRFGRDMEFCQLQLNYLDWEVQHGREKVKMLKELGIGVWVMEPVRGGFLANKIPEAAREKMKALRPDESIASWAFRWLMEKPELSVILSGMSDMEQTVDNIKTFSEDKPLNAEEKSLLKGVVDELNKYIACTACRYCTEGCPMGLDIPLLISYCNEGMVGPNISLKTTVNTLPEDKRPAACIACRTCEAVCPQHIKISEELKSFTDKLAEVPDWAVISREREIAARKLGF